MKNCMVSQSQLQNGLLWHTRYAKENFGIWISMNFQDKAVIKYVNSFPNGTDKPEASTQDASVNIFIHTYIYIYYVY